MPHALGENRLPSPRWALPCSAAWTPSWHQTEETTRMIVLAVAYGTLRIAVFSCHISSSTERMVKYMAKRPAKNISSLASQTIVPTETMLGRDTGPCPGMVPVDRGGSWVTADAVATGAIIATFGA